MAVAADITIKKNDGTTNIVWTLLNSSGGDAAPALWRSETAAGTVGQRPTYSVSSRWNGPKTVRRIDISGEFPSVFTNANTGQTEVRSTIPFTCSFGVPTNIIGTDVNEAASQLTQLVAHVMTVNAIKSGYAPT